MFVRSTLVFAFLLALGCETEGESTLSDVKTKSEGTIVIPFDQIWGQNIQGTQDVMKLDWKPIKGRTLSTGSLNFLKLLNKKQAEPGFVVAGRGQDALVAAHKILPDGQKPDNTLPEDTEVSVVYFSHGFPLDIELKRVERTESTISITYQFVDLGLDAAGQHFALIPLGKLPAGKYQVKMVELPPKNADVYYTQDFLASISKNVCQPFSFSIVSMKDKSD